MMKHLILAFVTLVLLSSIQAQKAVVTSEILSASQVSAIFTDSVKRKLNIGYPIFRVYKCADKRGQYYCALTESRDSIGSEADTFNYKIKAVFCKIENATPTKIWEINDNILKNHNDETTIWFWTRYFDFKDFDNDSIGEAIVVYGTFAMNGYGDGRIKFIIYHKGQKIAIRHQNGILDFERETEIDKAFYTLPAALQSAIVKKMETMTDREQAIFPAGWHSEMKNKKTILNERH